MIDPLVSLGVWIWCNYILSVIIGFVIIELVGSAIARQIIMKINLAGIGVSLTFGWFLGFVLRLILGIHC